jgi:hypothetical protein
MSLATQYHDVLLSKSPTMLWKCDDASGLLQDSSGNGNHADASVSLLYGQTDLWGGTGAIGCDAIGDWARRSSSTGFTQTDDFTATWIHKTHAFASGSWGMIQFGVGTFNGAPFDGWAYRALDWGTAGSRRFTAQTTAGALPASGDAVDLAQFTYYHIVVKREASAGAWKSWIDGVAQADNADTATPTAPTAGPFIMREPSGAAIFQSFGSIHSVAWFPTALSDTECAGLYTDATVLSAANSDLIVPLLLCQ